MRDRIDIRLAAGLLGLGLIGIASLLLLPVERLLPQPPPMPVGLLRALSLVNPAVLLIAAVLAGCLTAPRLGLDAPALRAALAGRSPAAVLRRQLRLAVPVAVATGLLLALYGFATRSYVAAAVGADALTASVAPWPVRLLYGGITEEILARWGVMSLASYLAWRVSGGAEPPPERVFGTGNAVAALLFALGHLPMLAALTGSPPAWLLATVLAANAVAGLAFGWLYRRAGLEAAMLAHLLAHAVAAVPAAIMS